MLRGISLTLKFYSAWLHLVFLRLVEKVPFCSAICLESLSLRIEPSRRGRLFSLGGGRWLESVGEVGALLVNGGGGSAVRTCGRCRSFQHLDAGINSRVSKS